MFLIDLGMRRKKESTNTEIKLEDGKIYVTNTGKIFKAKIISDPYFEPEYLAGIGIVNPFFKDSKIFTINGICGIQMGGDFLNDTHFVVREATKQDWSSAKRFDHIEREKRPKINWKLFRKMIKKSLKK